MKNNLDDHVRAYEGELQYDFDNEILLNWYPKRIIHFTKKSESVLELGLGHGYTTSIFSNYFEKHTVLEGSHAIIANFKKRYPDCKSKIVETYFENFTSAEKFDVIVMGFILEHVDNPIAILTYFKQFLNVNGKVFIAVPNAEVLNRRLGHLSGILPNMQQLSENDFMLGHKRYYTLQSLTGDVINANYEISLTEGIYLKPLTTQQMISLNLNRKIIDALCSVGVKYPELCCGILMLLKLDS